MSRVGRMPIPVPKGVKVAVAGDSFTAEGPKGKVSQALIAGFPVKIEDGTISVERTGDSGPERAKHGLLRALLANAVRGVHEGFSQGLEFLATNAGSNLVIDFGATPGANTLVWDASHNSSGTYQVVNFEAGVDTLEFGQYGSGLAFHDPALLARITVNGAAYAASNPGGGASWWTAIATPDAGDDPGRQIAVFHAAVPEPTSLLMAGAAALLAGFRRSN